MALVYQYPYQDLKVTGCSVVDISVDSHPVFVGHLCL